MIQVCTPMLKAVIVDPGGLVASQCCQISELQFSSGLGKYGGALLRKTSDISM